MSDVNQLEVSAHAGSNIAPSPSVLSLATAASVDDKIDEILQRAVTAQFEFAKLTQEQADRIFDAVAQEANKNRVPLAKLAVEETKMGCFEDKVIKNGIAWYV